MTDEKHQDGNQGGTDSKIKIDDAKGKLTIAGDHIQIDPETGKTEFTDEQREQMREAFGNLFSSISESRDAISATVEKISGAFNAFEKIGDTLNKAANVLFSGDFHDSLREMMDNLQPLSEFIEEIDELEPFINAELKKSEYGNTTLDDLLDNCTAAELLELRQDQDSLFYKAIQAARAAKGATLLDVDSYRADKLNTPVDRFNFLAWNNFKETGGQIAFNMMSERDKNDPERSELKINMRYSLSFGDDPNVKTTKELNHYDRRLTQAIDTLWTSGKDVILLSEIFYNMGGTSSNPNANQRAKINESLTKQGTARVYINNKAEAAQYDYPFIEYDGNILEFRRITVKYKGQEREAIKMLGRPIMMKLADERNQLTAVPMKAIQSDVSKTDKNLQIEDYLLYRITRRIHEIGELQGQQKKRYTQDRQRKINKSRKLTILLSTFYENTGNSNKKSTVKRRALETATRYLEHYQSEEGGYYIDSFNVDDERITIMLPIG